VILWNSLAHQAQRPGSPDGDYEKSADDLMKSIMRAAARARGFSGGGVVRDNPEFNERVADMTTLGRAGLPDDC